MKTKQSYQYEVAAVQTYEALRRLESDEPLSEKEIIRRLGGWNMAVWERSKMEFDIKHKRI